MLDKYGMIQVCSQQLASSSHVQQLASESSDLYKVTVPSQLVLMFLKKISLLDLSPESGEHLLF